jgi:glycopeptide antibiotics resistance protein
VIFLTPLVFFVSVCGFVGYAVALGRVRPTGARGLARWAVALSLIVIFAFTLFPTGGRRKVHLVPFEDITGGIGPPVDVSLLLQTGSNVLLFAPLGASLSLLGLSARTACSIGCALSISVEVAQWFVVSGRTTSVDDVILNTLGTFLGYVVAAHWLSRKGV